MDKLIWNASPQAVVLSSETYRLNYQASLPRLYCREKGKDFLCLLLETFINIKWLT